MGADSKAKIPQIRRTLDGYLGGEEGKISKSAVLAFGGTLASTILSTLLLSEPVSAHHSWHSWGNTPVVESITIN